MMQLDCLHNFIFPAQFLKSWNSSQRSSGSQGMLTQRVEIASHGFKFTQIMAKSCYHGIGDDMTGLVVGKQLHGRPKHTFGSFRFHEYQERLA